MAAQTDAFQLMQQIDQFYNNSWNHLMIYVASFATIVGLLVPYLNYIIQKRLFQAEEAKLDRKIEENMSTAKAALDENLVKITEAAVREIKNEFATKFKALEQAAEEQKKEVDKQIAAALEKVHRHQKIAKGGLLFIQMNQALKEENYVSAAEDAFHAMRAFVEGKEPLNLRRVGDMLRLEILPKLNGEQIINLKHQNVDLDLVVPEIKKLSSNGEFADLINATKLTLEIAKKRTSIVEPTPLPQEPGFQ